MLWKLPHCYPCSAVGQSSHRPALTFVTKANNKIKRAKRSKHLSCSGLQAVLFLQHGRLGHEHWERKARNRSETFRHLLCATAYHVCKYKRTEVAMLAAGRSPHRCRGSSLSETSFRLSAARQEEGQKWAQMPTVPTPGTLQSQIRVLSFNSDWGNPKEEGIASVKIWAVPSNNHTWRGRGRCSLPINLCSLWQGAGDTPSVSSACAAT